MGKLCQLLNIAMTGTSVFLFVCFSLVRKKRFVAIIFLVFVTKASNPKVSQNLPKCLPCYRACVMGTNLMCFYLGNGDLFLFFFQIYAVYWQKVRNIQASQGT